MRYVIVILFLFFSARCGFAFGGNFFPAFAKEESRAHFWQSEKGVAEMKLEINEFTHNQKIPSEYTCDGQDVSPQIKWSDLPVQTKSLALTVIDPDAPMGNFVHWLVYDIPKEAAGIPKGGPLSKGTKEVDNGFGRASYGGPCPPSGTHRYFFTLYALDVEHLDGVTSSNFLTKVKEHCIAQTEIIGLYSRK